jgi:polysaccharide pyruvyl transferase CsaB
VRVLLSGYYGFGNLGDEAILESICSFLKERGHEPGVLSAAPDDTSRRFDLPAFQRTSPIEVMKGIRWSQAVWSGGGGLLQDKTSAKSLTYYLGILDLARLAGRPYSIVAQSLGPLSARGGRRTAARLKRARSVVVRDTRSAAMAASLGVSATLGADAALLVPSPPVQRGDTLVLVPRGDEPGHNHRLAAFAREWPGEKRLLYLSPTDLAACPEMAATRFPAVFAARLPEAFEALQGAAAVVSVRLHGLILATVAGLPSIGFAYDPKVESFADEAGIPLDLGAGLYRRPALDPARAAELRRRALSGLAAALQAHLG